MEETNYLDIIEGMLYLVGDDGVDLKQIAGVLEISKKEAANLMKEFEKDAYQLPVKFTGRLSYEKMVENLSNCDMAINPIRKGSAGSIINKVGDYAMAGLPVINTQECLEYRNLIDIYNAGINCECENEDQIAKAISQLIESKELRNEMGKGNRKLAEEKFDRAITYKEIVMVINSLQK